jgi:hypothetical protein
VVKHERISKLICHAAVSPLLVFMLNPLNQPWFTDTKAFFCVCFFMHFLIITICLHNLFEKQKKLPHKFEIAQVLYVDCLHID